MVPLQRSQLCVGQPHPAVLCEPPAIAAARLPPLSPDLELRIPRSLVESGALSSPQVETVTFAAQRFQSKLACGARGGYVLGDGTGCGKGRCIAALLLDEWNRGNRRSLWVSLSGDLAEDAERDLRDISAGLPLCRLARVPPGVDLDSAHGARCAELDALGPKREGVIFLTYALLASGTPRAVRRPSRRPERSRFGQVLAWLRGGREGKGRRGAGLIVFDEAHRAKNLQESPEPRENGGRGQAQRREGTKAGLLVDELQRLLPGCAVLYASATCATEVRHLGYMRRLGLWGEGHTSFRDFSAFRRRLERGGVPAMELLAVRLRSLGVLSCRSLSFDGVSFETALVPLSRQAEDQYDAACALWRDVLTLVHDIAADAKLAGLGGKNVTLLFWAAQQQFFKSLLVAAKVDAAVRIAEAALERGESVVISLWSTHEARMRERLVGLSPGGVVRGSLSGPEMILAHFIERHLPCADRSGHTIPWAARAVADLRERLERLRLPGNPLDDLIARLGGPGRVAELTGRSHRVVTGGDGRRRLVARQGGCGGLESASLAEQRAFQHDQKRVAIITEAASSGISLHSDNRLSALGVQPRRRCMVCVELPWAADKAVQQFGRVHRSNQAAPPRFVLVATRIPGEQRFVSAVAHRLRLLGAVTRGDQRAPLQAGGGFSEAQDLHGEYGSRALDALLTAVHSGKQPRRVNLATLTALKEQFSGDWGKFAVAARREFDVVELGALPTWSRGPRPRIPWKSSGERPRQATTDGPTITRLLNRMLMMPCAMQRALLEALSAILASLRLADQELGQLADEGLQPLVQRYRARAVHIAMDEPVARGRLGFTTLRIDRGMAWEEALQRVRTLELTPPEGFYHRDAGPAESNVVLVLRRHPARSCSMKPSYVIYEPCESVVYLHGLSITEEILASSNGFVALSAELHSSAMQDFARKWRRRFEMSSAPCGHEGAAGLSRKKACLHCRRFDEVLLLTGDGLFMASDTVEEVFSTRPIMVRARSSCGSPIVGVVVPSSHKAQLLSFLETSVRARSSEVSHADGAHFQTATVESLDASDSFSDGSCAIEDVSRWRNARAVEIRCSAYLSNRERPSQLECDLTCAQNAGALEDAAIDVASSEDGADVKFVGERRPRRSLRLRPPGIQSVLALRARTLPTQRRPVPLTWARASRAARPTAAASHPRAGGHTASPVGSGRTFRTFRPHASLKRKRSASAEVGPAPSRMKGHALNTLAWNNKIGPWFYFVGF
eukprot:TRINITY_DN13105_c0_g6_i1.p1 TRINITY_DN13105_c0_g6~~TRINITY_DN13105_c0_g6_i1.p1  ORF type:complete len:1265 (-),score=199.65 TRINITY_DN13105_c0_g6_i1:33-3770(-)